ncbi:questin oxidase family protein [Streptomyces bathyalis]|uniref:Questin oxidase family protein n=1 Tax=Streptomyces bathyalis TaxID=2710756 RepID=A0A7T1TBK0_9ACTN|nr:questin oxidase family protein [Streptomyces bathyalis]QPP09937.1 questin oxidase family protein [Streptomyces bathyalis]
MDTDRTDSSGTLDEALERLHRSGPEREDWLSNHAPMAVEALVRHGKARTVHRWLDQYEDNLEDMPGRSSPVTDADWREALGDPRRLADWIGYFTRTLQERPWREVLAEWWPRLLPGISAAATHGVIRVGHAVRTLLDEPAVDHRGAPAPGPRLTELAHALGYWAARHWPLPGIGLSPGASSPAAALHAVPRIQDQSGGFRDRVPRITALPGLPGSDGAGSGAAGPGQARAALEDVVRAATHLYATHAHGQPVMLVHAATAPNAVLRTLPALPERLWVPSLEAAWSAAALVTAAYAPAAPSPAPLDAASRLTSEEVFERAAAHGDEHAIKLTDTALDVAARDAAGTGNGSVHALAAALRSVELIDPAA